MLMSHRERREASNLYHSALQVCIGPERYVIEMTPAWGNVERNHGVMCRGPVGLLQLGRSRYFRYEVRRWRDGRIPDVAEAVGGPHRLSTTNARAQLLLDLVPAFPTAIWGRDQFHTGDMWNSNSLTSWLLVSSGHDSGGLRPPDGGRAPGWQAGSTVAARQVRIKEMRVLGASSPCDSLKETQSR